MEEDQGEDGRMHNEGNERKNYQQRTNFTEPRKELSKSTPSEQHTSLRRDASVMQPGTGLTTVGTSKGDCTCTVRSTVSSACVEGVPPARSWGNQFTRYVRANMQGYPQNQKQLASGLLVEQVQSCAPLTVREIGQSVVSFYFTA